METTASSRTGETSFPLLDLPADVRNMIYHLTLPTRVIRPQPVSASSAFSGSEGTHPIHPEAEVRPSTEPVEQSRHPYVNLLLTNHQIFHEASYVLCHHCQFVLTVDWMRVGFPTIGTKDFQYHLQLPTAKLATSIQHIIMEINWRTSYHLNTRTAKCNLHSILVDLESFSGLRNVVVEWRDFLDGLYPVPPEHWCWEMLRSFRDFGIRCPKLRIMVQMPARLRWRNRNLGEYVEVGNCGEEMGRVLGY